jgi:antibiotic biosynthesis monooxygenase (ABM) superfamily enzyme
MYAGAQSALVARGRIAALGWASEPATPRRGSPRFSERIITMLYTIAVVLLILWLLGLVSSYTIGGFIHVLLVLALIVVLLRVIGGRSAL